MEETKGIKEIMELLEGVKVIGVSAKAMMADGKVDLKDIPEAIELLKQYQTIIEAFKGAGEIPHEVKDMSVDELQAVGAKVLEIASALKG